MADKWDNILSEIIDNKKSIRINDKNKDIVKSYTCPHGVVYTSSSELWQKCSNCKKANDIIEKRRLKRLSDQAKLEAKAKKENDNKNNEKIKKENKDDKKYNKWLKSPEAKKEREHPWQPDDIYDK